MNEKIRKQLEELLQGWYDQEYDSGDQFCKGVCSGYLSAADELRDVLSQIEEQLE